MVELTFGEWLKDRLDEAGMEQQQLAARLGVNASTISKWVHGLSTPHANTCDRIAAELDLDPDEVRDRAGRPPRPRLVRADDDRLASGRYLAEEMAGLRAAIERLEQQIADLKDEQK